VIKLSVVLCTLNQRRAYMQRVLESLDRQTLSKKHWELLIVDNASAEPVADEWSLSWHPQARHVREDVVGLLSARLRGIAESVGELCVCFDDDTIVDPQYLEMVLSIFASHPHLGVIGSGSIEMECPVAPPAALRQFMPMLGIRVVNSPRWSNNPEDASCRPHGAGLCVTRDVGAAYRRLVKEIGAVDVIGRHGQSLFSGEDDLLAWAASAVGMGFGVFPELRLTHLISPDRIVPDYFIRLIHDHTFSHSLLNYVFTGRKPQTMTLQKRIRILANGLKHGRYSMRCCSAYIRGEAAAADFVKGRGLRPILVKAPPKVGSASITRTRLPSKFA
jgi:glycosyltransferase involved in cell wall biosynthesis